MNLLRLLLAAVCLFSLAPNVPAPQAALAVAPTAWVLPGGAAAQEGAVFTYVVQRGDSLARIATRFNVTIEALIVANNLTTTTLQPGQVLIIPGAAPAPGAPAAPEAAPEAAPPEETGSTIYGRIQGSPAFVRRVQTALEWMQARDPDSFQRVEDYVTVIMPSPFAHFAVAVPLPGGCEVRALARPGMSVEMMAALLYHEASHCQQFATVGVLPSKDAEIYAYGEQLSFMWRNGFSREAIDYYYRVLDYYKAAPDDGQFVRPPNF